MINPFKPDPVKKTYDIKFAKVDADCPCGSRSQQEIAYVDTDGDGKDTSRDSALLIDFNGDGKYDKQEMARTARAVRAMRSPAEAAQNEDVRRLDTNGDGVVTGEELKTIKLGQDYNRDGNFTAHAMGDKAVEMNGNDMSFMLLELRDDWKERANEGPKFGPGGHLICGSQNWNLSDGSGLF